MSHELQTQIIPLLTRRKPDPEALRRALCYHVTPRMLEEIANADGGYGFRENLPLLHSIRKVKKLPSRLEWFPKEVLELVRWKNPAPDDRDGHVKRAFVCGVLIEAGGDPANHGYMYAENETLISLIESTRILGRPYAQATLHLVVWRMLGLQLFYGEGVDEEYPFFAFAVLLLCLETGVLHRKPASLLQLIDWVIAVEALVRQNEYAIIGSDHWLLGLAAFHNQRHDLWKSVARDILLNPGRPHPERAAARLIEIGQKIVNPL